MPDISMCAGLACDVRENCYRFIAKPSEPYQSWFTESPTPTGEECDFYWPVESQNTAKTQQVEGHGHD